MLYLLYVNVCGGESGRAQSRSRCPGRCTRSRRAHEPGGEPCRRSLSLARRTALDVVCCALAMPTPRFSCRCLVFLLLVAAGACARPAEAAKRPFADIVDSAARRHGVDGPDAVDAGHAARPRRLGRLRPPAECRRRRRLPAPPHRQVRDHRSRPGRLQRRTPAPCGVTMASRHIRRDTRLRTGRSRPRPTNCRTHRQPEET